MDVTQLVSFFCMFFVTRWENSLCVVWQFLCVLVCVGPWPLFLLCFCCCFSWRNANLAGGFAGRLPLRLLLFLFWCFLLEFAHDNLLMETTAFHAEFIIRLTCLYLFSGPSLRATSAEPEEKKCAFLQSRLESQSWNSLRVPWPKA